MGTLVSFVSEGLACNGGEHVLIGHWVLVGTVMEGDGANDNTTNCPEHLQHLGSSGSQLDWYDLTAVCRRVGNEDTPWYALEKLGYENNWKRLGEVKREDEDVQEHEAGQGCVAVSNTAREGPS